MYTEEEKQYLALTDKFKAELVEIEEQIAELTRRRDVIISVLDGTAEVEPEGSASQLADPSDPAFETLISYIEKNPGITRAEILEQWNMDAKDLSRVLNKGKRRGVLHVEGKSRAAKWYATTKATASGRPKRGRNA